jgi:formylglycine-generating enzyme required for sulfatase activity
MHRPSATHRALTWFFFLGFAFSLPGPLGLMPSVEAASASASARIIKKLKKQVKTLKAQLAAATATATPAPFVEMVKVGNAGNVADFTNFGAVPYEYSIGKYEVTLAQYTTFLNAVAATDTFGLFNANLATNPNTAGITQSGTSGSFTYSVIGTGTRPVTFVSWFDAARFCNWLHNGRPSGAQTAATTENGAYPLNGATSGGSTIARNPGAKFWIPSENEWYKAAYHQPSGQGGPGDNYWLYPTGSDTAPIDEAPPGGANSVNIGVVGPTAVGAYTGSASFYGTFDQGGNVFEWYDAVSGSPRGVRGSAWGATEPFLRSSNLGLTWNQNTEFNNFGFRVAGAVPPAAAARPAALPKVSTSGPPARVIKALKKQVATLKAQLAAATATPAAFVEMVKVGNAGNVADSTNFGAVPYEYSIGKNEVTMSQYTTFLNAVAATDTFSLFNASMETDNTFGGIDQSGTSGSFTYSVIGTGTRPVTFVSWFDAARFCNWLHNGRPSGAQTAVTTENGAYPLNGATSGGLTITRNPGAKYWIPSEDEWYKAAYHQPSGQGGPGDNYWLYPTGSDTAPTAEAPPGGANSANFDLAVRALTAVGAYTGSASFYGTFDQGGNVFEWNDAVIGGTFRGLRGGSWVNFDEFLRSSNRISYNPDFEDSIIGFRVASP